MSLRVSQQDDEAIQSIVKSWIAHIIRYGKHEFSSTKILAMTIFFFSLYITKHTTADLWFFYFLTKLAIFPGTTFRRPHFFGAKVFVKESAENIFEHQKSLLRNFANKQIFLEAFKQRRLRENEKKT